MLILFDLDPLGLREVQEGDWNAQTGGGEDVFLLCYVLGFKITWQTLMLDVMREKVWAKDARIKLH